MDLIEKTHQQGRQEGREIGREEGILIGRIQTYEDLLGLRESTEGSLAKLNISELKKLAKQLQGRLPRNR